MDVGWGSDPPAGEGRDPSSLNFHPLGKFIPKSILLYSLFLCCSSIVLPSLYTSRQLTAIISYAKLRFILRTKTQASASSRVSRYKCVGYVYGCDKRKGDQ